MSIGDALAAAKMRRLAFLLIVSIERQTSLRRQAARRHETAWPACNHHQADDFGIKHNNGALLTLSPPAAALYLSTARSAEEAAGRSRCGTPLRHNR